MLQKKYQLQENRFRDADRERRQYTRFKAKEDAVVIISTQSAKLYGFMVDISKGGISFEYIPSNDEMIDTKELNIVLDGTGLRFDRLPSKSVSDFELQEEDYTPVKMRRQGVQFVGLTKEQVSNLEWFIQDSALEMARNN